jgi:hypothetical protein
MMSYLTKIQGADGDGDGDGDVVDGNEKRNETPK